MTSDNSFICEECGRHMFDGNMCILSCTRYYEGLICVTCSELKYPKLVRKAIRDREREVNTKETAMKFSDLHTGAFFRHGKYKAEYIKVEDFEDASGVPYNSIMLSGGMLSRIKPNETVFPNDKSVEFMSGSQLHRLKSLAMDAEILHACSDLSFFVQTKAHFEWYFYYKENDPKFSAACDMLEHVLNTKGLGSKAYVAAIKKCRSTLKSAIERSYKKASTTLGEMGS